jgi:hypothetical protein
MTAAPCLNCLAHPAFRGNLCLPCLLDEPDLLQEYATVEEAPYPVEHLPGSPAKIEQLALRYACRYSLFHPLDVVLMTITLERVGSYGPRFTVEMPVPGRRPPEVCWGEGRDAA